MCRVATMTAAKGVLRVAIRIARIVVTIVILVWWIIGLRIIDHAVVVGDRGVLLIVRRMIRRILGRGV